MDYKSMSVFIAHSMPPEMVNGKIEHAISALKKDGFEVFSVVALPTQHGSIVVASGKKPTP